VKNRNLFVIIYLIILSSCNPVVRDFDTEKVDLNNIVPISDSIMKLNLILKNDTISGFSESISGLEESMKNPSFYKYARHNFDSCFWNERDSVYYLLDSVLIGDNIGYLILTNYKLFIGKGYDRTIYLSFFDQNRKNIKTYCVSRGVDAGDGLIGGGVHSKSKLYKNNTLYTYYSCYGYLDIGPDYEDSIVYSYDMANFKALKTDTIKHIVKRRFPPKEFLY
jgi:hypothetical protein